MPFEPGNKVKSRANTPGALVGASRIQGKRRNASLAAHLQDNACPEWIAAWLFEVVAGRDPRVTMRDVDPSTNRRRVGRPTNAPDVATQMAQLPTLEQSLAAMTQLLLRRDGAPAQHQYIQAEVRAQALVGNIDVDRDRLAGMPLEARRQLAEAQRLLIRAPAQAEEPVDAEIVEDAAATPPAVTP